VTKSWRNEMLIGVIDTVEISNIKRDQITIIIFQMDEIEKKKLMYLKDSGKYINITIEPTTFRGEMKC
jgi:hypothetical protein